MNSMFGHLIVVGGVFLALATLPRWCLLPINRSAIWELLDTVDGHIRSGALPYENPAVLDLRREIVISIDLLPTLTPGMMRRMRRLIERTPPKPRAATATGLTEDQAKIMESCRDRLYELVARTIMVNSWSAIGLFWVSFAKGSIRLPKRAQAGDRTVHVYRKINVSVRASDPLSGDIEVAEKWIENADRWSGDGQTLLAV